MLEINFWKTNFYFYMKINLLMISFLHEKNFTCDFTLGNDWAPNP